MVTKKELKDIKVNEVFATGELNIIITDGNHVIHNINGKMVVAEKYGAVCKTYPKYIKAVLNKGVVKMLEKLLMEALKIETRQDPNTKKEILLDLNRTCDLVYIRMYFKRLIAKNKINEIKAYYTWNNAYTITKESYVNGWNRLETREKIIQSLRNIITDSQQEGTPVFSIKFN
jgi:hypothetical protein